MAKIADSIESAPADNVESYSTETPAARPPRPRAPVLTVPGAAVGRRKQAIARVRLVPGSGTITVNGREFADYFPNKLHQQLINDPFKVLDLIGGYDVDRPHHRRWPLGPGRRPAPRRSLVPSTRSTARTTVPPSRRPASSLVTLASSSARRLVSRRPVRRPQFSKR